MCLLWITAESLLDAVPCGFKELLQMIQNAVSIFINHLKSQVSSPEPWPACAVVRGKEFDSNTSDLKTHTRVQPDVWLAGTLCSNETHCISVDIHACSVMGLAVRAHQHNLVSSTSSC